MDLRLPPFPPERLSAAARAEATAIALTLYQQKGNFSEADRTIGIALDRDTGTLSIERGPTLRRKTAR
jgi:hypothetical protein